MQSYDNNYDLPLLYSCLSANANMIVQLCNIASYPWTVVKYNATESSVSLYQSVCILLVVKGYAYSNQVFFQASTPAPSAPPTIAPYGPARQSPVIMPPMAPRVIRILLPFGLGGGSVD
jgi:hypothetical protein